MATICLAEQAMGAGPDILFPNISSCIAVLVADAQLNLAGVHCTKSTERAFFDTAGRMLQALLPGRAVAQVYCVGVLSEWHNAKVPLSKLGQCLRETLNYSGSIKSFDLMKFRKSQEPFKGSQSMAVYGYVKAKNDTEHKVKVLYGGPDCYAPNGTAPVPQSLYSARAFAFDNNQVAYEKSTLQKPVRYNDFTFDTAKMRKLVTRDYTLI